MSENRSYSIHTHKQSQADKSLDARQSLRRNLEETAHRLETIAEVNGVEWISDSRSTDLLSTRDTFKCLNKPIIWLAAVPEHERDYALIAKQVRHKVKSLLVYPREGADMHRKLESYIGDFRSFNSLDAAVQAAFEVAVAGDVVIYSPSCHCEDGYGNFVERGNAFSGFVKARASQ